MDEVPTSFADASDRNMLSSLTLTAFASTCNITMQNFDIQPQILTSLSIGIDFPELEGKIQTGTKRPDILATAKKTLHRVNSIWDPAIVYRWLPIEQSDTTPGQSLIRCNNGPVTLDLGYSSVFVKKVGYALIAVYTAGGKLEEETQKATDDEEFLVAFLLDLIGLLVLKKIGNIVNKIAELGWGVSPFLSPGSIHGWELEDQLKLCPLLPLNKIGVQLRDDAVLTPFKSLSCLIGIGAEYKSCLVGTTCS